MQIQYENRGGAGHLCGAVSVSDFGDAFLLDDTGKEYSKQFARGGAQGILGGDCEMAKGKYEEWLEPDSLLLISAWARDGLTDDQIANNMGISRSTLSEWKRKFPDISDALKKSKAVVDIEVENALYQAAIDGNMTAIIFWLKNRKPEKWRDRQQVEMSGEVGRGNPFEGLTTEELKKLAGDG